MSQEKGAKDLDSSKRLAYERTFLALERRQMALVRTVLALITFVFGILLAFALGVGSVVIADEGAEEPPNKPVAEPKQKPAEPAEGALGRLESRMLGATPEERARLAEERARISEAAASFGTDPTAIVGFFQLGYGYSTFTNELRVNAGTAVVRLPLTPNWLLQVTMPYVWANPSNPGVPALNGTGDMVVRTGGRVYASQNLTLFIGADATFPTASERPLGTGKYTLGPGVGVAVPLARLRSLFFTVVEDFNTIGGDPSRPNLHFLQVQSAINTIWTERWWSLASMTWDVDWNNNRKTTMNLLGQVGHRFDQHWNAFVGAGAGVVGKDTFLGLDWTVQAGVRWVFRTPLLPERILGKSFGKPAPG